MAARKIYTDVIFAKLRTLDLKWFIHKAYVYFFLKAEKYLKTGYSPPPLTMGMAVTENCNLRCPMCVLPLRHMKDPKEMPTEILKKVIDNLHELGVGGIAISGGEPTVRKDFLELVSYAKKNGTTVTLNSNLLLLTDEKIQKMSEDPPHNINFSIDSPIPEINDKLRGGHRVLNKVLDRVKALKENRDATKNKYSITAVTVLSDMNLDDLDLLFKTAAESGADSLCFLPLHGIENDKTYAVKADKIKGDFYEGLKKLSLKYNLSLGNSARYLKGVVHIMRGGVMKERCNAGYTQMIIGNDLKLYRCVPYMNMGKPLFEWDPSKVSLKKLWNSKEWRKDRLEALKCKECFFHCHAELTFLVPM